MKTVLLALVLANLLFYMYSTWVGEPSVDRPPRQPATGTQLKLLSELGDLPEVQVASAQTPQPEAPDEVLAAQDAGAPGEKQPPEAEDQNANDEAALAPLLTGPELAEKTESEPSSPVKTPLVAAIESEPSPEPEIAPTEIVEANERPPEASVQAPPETPTGDVSLAAASSAPSTSRCVSLGPFLNLSAATQAASRLREEGREPRQRLKEQEVWVGHWVHLPPMASRDEAVTVVETLREAGVKDIYIEPRGDKENAVSLGLFSDRENAEIYAGQVRKQGVKPQITDRYRFGSVYFVDFTLPAGAPFEATSYGGAAGQEIDLTDRPCDNPDEGAG